MLTKTKQAYSRFYPDTSTINFYPMNISPTDSFTKTLTLLTVPLWDLFEGQFSEQMIPRMNYPRTDIFPIDISPNKNVIDMNY